MGSVCVGQPDTVCVCVCVRSTDSGPEINDSTREPDTCLTFQQMAGPSSLHAGESACVCVCVFINAVEMEKLAALH